MGNTKKTVILILLGVVTAPLTIYTWLVLDVMGHVDRLLERLTVIWGNVTPYALFKSTYKEFVTKTQVFTRSIIFS